MLFLKKPSLRFARKQKLFEVIYSCFTIIVKKTVAEMESDKTVVPQNIPGFVSWVLKLLGLPISFANCVYQYFMSRNLKNSLPGQVVLITGASSGLGEALAHTFYVAGCKVVLAARRQDELEKIRKNLLQLHSVS